MEFNITHWNWAQENNIKIFLCRTQKQYGVTKMVGGRKKKVSLPYVNICASLDGNNVRFKEEYKQEDEELPSIINKLYEHYYVRANS